MLHCHKSQFYEWLPFNSGTLHSVPNSPNDQYDWLADRLKNRFRSIADKYRNKLIECYGETDGNNIRFAEAFESCEYGSQLNADNLPILFPFYE